MNIVIVGINPELKYNLAPALLKSYCLKDYSIKKYAQIKLKYFSTNDKDDEILKEIKMERPTVIAFSCYIWNIYKILKITKSIRKLGFKGSIILGGPEVSPIAQQILVENPSVDIIVREEGEVTFSEIVRHLLSKQKSLDDILGITFWKDRNIVENKPRPLIDKLDDIPSPYLNGVVNLNKIEQQLAMFETLRGCTFSCKYCLWGKGQRLRYFSLKRVKQELLAVMNSNVRRVWLSDPISNFNKARFKKILRIILRNNSKKVIFDFEMKAEFLDKEMINLLSKLPGGYIAFGLQSTNLLVLKNINRKWNKKIFERNIKLLQKKAKRIEIAIDLIYGLPGDTYESYKKSFGYAMSFQPHNIQSHRLQVLPGSYIYNNAACYGIEFMARAPHYFLRSSTFSLEDCKKARIFYYLYNKLLVKIAVNQLHKCLGISHLELFEKLLKYLIKKTNLRKIKARSFLKHLTTFIKINLSYSGVPKEVTLPFLELIKYLYLTRRMGSNIEKGRYSKRKGVLSNLSVKPDNIRVEKFHYNIENFVTKKLFDKDADIKDIEKKSNFIVYNEKLSKINLYRENGGIIINR